MELDTEKLQEMKQHYEEGTELTDDELDLVADVTIDCIRSILACFGEEHSAIDEYEGDEGELILDVTGGNLNILIGRHGRNLEAVQTLVASLVSRKLGFRYPIVVDIEGYKSARKEKVRSIAYGAASRAKQQHRPMNLPVMNAYERRIAHLALADDPELTTYSEGIEPNRHVVVAPVA